MLLCYALCSISNHGERPCPRPPGMPATVTPPAAALGSNTLAPIVEEGVAAGASGVLVDALPDGPVPLCDVVHGALLCEVAAHAVPIDRDERRRLRRAGGGHHLVIDEAGHVRAHVADQHVGARQQLDLGREREWHVLVGVAPELHPAALDKLGAREVEEDEVELLLLAHLAQH
eukprot:scaffold19163_cov103-Isochrysis_galbana.AAC.4